jgi:hypothetical protein
MPFLKTSNDGEVFIDHSASPGIPADLAQQMGLPSNLVGEGQRMTAPTLACPHCGGCVVLNPMRIRARAHCYNCNSYICDGCAAAMRDPNYIHRTIRQVADMVQSGKWTVSGSMSNPVLTPTEK